jgi:hypothetical protein
MLSRHGSLFLQPVDQLHCAVVAQAQTVRNRCHCRSCAFRQSPDGQQKLMLLWFHAMRARSLFGKVQKLPDPEAKLGKLAVIGCGDLPSPRTGLG